MPLRAFALAPLALVCVLAAPALAQESPSPSPSMSCPPSASDPQPVGVDCDDASPAPSPTVTTRPTPHGDPACPAIAVAWPASPVTANAPVTITVRFTDGGGPGFLDLARSAPGEPVDVRRTDTPTVTTTFTVRLPVTTTLSVSGGRDSVIDCIGGGPSSVQRTIAVRPLLSLAAARTAVRTCSFTGRVLPGRGQAVALYRVTPDGSRVLTSRSTVRADGTYRFDRHFTGSGLFGFVATVGTSSTNVAGQSAVRPTLIH